MSLTYQQGEYAIAAGAQTFTVPFGVAFATKPAAVLPVLVNEGPATLAGEPKYLLSVNLGVWDASGFVVELSAPTNRSDYKIVWVAGDFSALFNLTAQVKKINQLPRRTRPVKASDLVLVVDPVGVPVTETMTASEFFRNQVELVAVPTSPITPGSTRTIAIDDTYVHTYHNGVWKKFRRDGATVTQPAPWRLVSDAVTAVSGDRILADTSAASFVVSLPGAPAVGDSVEFADAATAWETNALIVSRNGYNISGLAEDLTCDVDARFSLVFVGGPTGWKIIP